jgi:hypothetical protein
VGLGRTFKRYARGFWLLALFPKKKLLAGKQGDQQCKYRKQALLNMQWREMQLGGTLTIHPEAPPTLGNIGLRAFVVALR